MCNSTAETSVSLMDDRKLALTFVHCVAFARGLRTLSDFNKSQFFITKSEEFIGELFLRRRIDPGPLSVVVLEMLVHWMIYHVGEGDEQGVRVGVLHAGHKIDETRLGWSMNPVLLFSVYLCRLWSSTDFSDKIHWLSYVVHYAARNLWMSKILWRFVTSNGERSTNPSTSHY